MSANDILKRIFGHNEFREYQEEAVNALLEKRDLLTVLPTGGGKSLCYQLPSLMMDGVTVVISPLIALMQDQVTVLLKNSIEACMISSFMDKEEAQNIYSKLLKNEIKLLYISPERMAIENFVLFLQKLRINFFVIDEAHCVSEWGHEFRDDYRKLDRIKKFFPNIPIAAFTATATHRVADDIIKHLSLKDPVFIRGKTFRKNLLIRARRRIGDGRRQLEEFLKEHKGKSGIVYTFTRKEAEKTASFLIKKGFKAGAYHAKLSKEERGRIYKDFIYDRIDIVVATVAFGMGIDKSDIRFVVHLSMPKTLENYYQEIGRAGRDGLESEVLLLFSKSDEIKRSMLLEDIEDISYKKIAAKKLAFMYKYALSTSCRHQIIAEYFGDEIGKCITLCDNCLKSDIEYIDITIEAQKMLSAIYRTGQRFGFNHIIDILRGSTNQNILRFNHDKLSVYAIGKELSKEKWSVVSDTLLEISALSLAEHRALKIEKEGFMILKKQKEVRIDKERFEIKENIKKQKIEIEYEKNEYFEKFKELRSKIAKEEGVPAYIVFTDKTLIELSNKLPLNKEEILKINGIGEVKYERYGERFLKLCREFR